MSKERSFQRSGNSDSVVLGAYPSTENCLSWAEEGIAVAAGANVYLVSQLNNGSYQFIGAEGACSTKVLRVDQFSHTEWPELPLATVQDLSLGEEQTDSTVVALSWSPPGLGVHRRCVLAVLTSNLLLSLWETDGSRNGWQRTCVINHYVLNKSSVDASNLEARKVRRRARIRAFTWCRPLKILPSDQWGAHCLIAVDDDDNVVVLSISKDESGEYGFWSISTLCTAALTHNVPLQNGATTMTKLQMTVLQRSYVKRLEVGEWEMEEVVASHSTSAKARALITCKRAYQTAPIVAFLEISAAELDTINSLGTSSTDASSVSLNGNLTISNGMTQSNIRERCEIVHNIKARPEWRDALEPICCEYQEKNELDGLFRIRFWGFATSPNRDYEAACVTLHPWDMFEYTSAANEKCRLLFRMLDQKENESCLVHRNDGEVFDLILTFLVRFIRNGGSLDTELDERVIKVLRSRATLVANYANEVKVLDHVLEERTQGLMVSAPVARVTVTEPTTLSITEICEICGVEIPMHVETQAATCGFGHSFPRCSLSQVAIQEPGISKYCSQCNRHFLNLPKLGPHRTESLVSRLFDEFDICPYCGGKYRS